jgi:hypothetical protein
MDRVPEADRCQRAADAGRYRRGDHDPWITSPLRTETMPEWVLVNGARIERTYLEENLQEARAQEWLVPTDQTHYDHRHCMVCTVAIDMGHHSRYMTSKAGVLCASCYAQFIVR